jgi:hypothetical protein
MDKRTLTMIYRVSAVGAIALTCTSLGHFLFGGGDIFPPEAIAVIPLVAMALTAYLKVNPNERAPYVAPDVKLNPATGLPIVNGLDSAGNPLGFDHRIYRR